MNKEFSSENSMLKQTACLVVISLTIFLAIGGCCCPRARPPMSAMACRPATVLLITKCYYRPAGKPKLTRRPKRARPAAAAVPNIRISYLPSMPSIF